MEPRLPENQHIMNESQLSHKQCLTSESKCLRQENKSLSSSYLFIDAFEAHLLLLYLFTIYLDINALSKLTK